MKSDDLTFHRSKSIRGAAASLIGSEVPASMRVCGAALVDIRFTVEMELGREEYKSCETQALHPPGCEGHLACRTSRA